MAAKYTKQTPQQVREWLDGQPVEFSPEWTLNEVAEEARRRNLAGRWGGSGIEASRAIARWGAYKLATFRDFSATHWDWLTAPGAYSPNDLYPRLLRVLEPAVGAGMAWRTTDQTKSKLLREIGEKALDLLAILETEGRLNITFAEVVGHKPELQPLLDRSSEITSKRSRQVQEWARTDRQQPLPMAEFPGFLGGPHLTDYLAALVAKIAGEGRRAYPSFRSVMGSSPPDEPGEDGVGDDDDIDPEEISKLLGFPNLGPFDPDLLRKGGEFGGAPGRTDSLLNAVIRAFPEALFDRFVEPPKVPPASVIEAACLAWFGDAPTQKEINARIRDDRARLEAQMERAINGNARLENLRASLKEKGLSDEEIRRKSFETFLGEE